MDVPALDAPPATIVIIDDDPPITRLIYDTVELEGYEAIVCHTGQDGIARALELIPHLIVLDLLLPAISGFDVAARLRANPRTAHIPMIVVSARHDVVYKVRALEQATVEVVRQPPLPQGTQGRLATGRRVAGQTVQG